MSAAVWYESLPAGLPEGRLVTPYNGDVPLYWLSRWPVTEDRVWASWHARHHETGLWPLLVSGVSDDDPIKPDAEDSDFTTIEEHDGPAVLAAFWSSIEDDKEPFGQEWPGTADAPDAQGPPGYFAAEIADLLLDADPHLALVPAEDGAHALTGIGWTGPLNHENDTALIAAVVAEWQQRFGAVVVGLGFDTLVLSVAAPPVTQEQALRVAAEHFAFCPDNIWQGNVTTIAEYASAIRGSKCWTFWWD